MFEFHWLRWRFFILHVILLDYIPNILLKLEWISAFHISKELSNIKWGASEVVKVMTERRSSLYSYWYIALLPSTRVVTLAPWLICSELGCWLRHIWVSFDSFLLRITNSTKLFYSIKCDDSRCREHQ